MMKSECMWRHCPGPFLLQEAVYPDESPRKEMGDKGVPFGGRVFRQRREVHRKPLPTSAVFLVPEVQ